MNLYFVRSIINIYNLIKLEAPFKKTIIKAKFKKKPIGIPIKFIKKTAEAITSINPKISKILAVIINVYNPLKINIEAKIIEILTLKLKMQKIAAKISNIPKIKIIIFSYLPNNMR